METFKKLLKNSNKVGVILSVIIVSLFSIVIWLFMVHVRLEFKNDYFDTYGQQQLSTLENAKKHAKKILKNGESEARVIDEVLSQTETGNNRFWFFGTDSEILFLKNNEQTLQTIGNNFPDLIKSFEQSGGESTETLHEYFINKKDGSLLISAKSKGEKYLVSQRFFEVNQKVYVIGIATSEKFIIKNGNLNQYNISAVVLYAVFTAIIIITIPTLTMIITKQNKRYFSIQKVVKDKNYIIESLSTPSAITSQVDKELQLYDEVTGIVYRKSFITTFLSRANSPSLFPMAIVVFQFGDKMFYEDSVLTNVAKVIKNRITQKDILAREDNRFILVIPKATNADVLVTIMLIQNDILKEDFNEKLFAEYTLINNKCDSLEDILEQTEKKIESQNTFL